MTEIDGMLIVLFGLQHGDPVPMLLNLVWMCSFVTAVMGIQLSAQQGPPQGPVGFGRGVTNGNSVLSERSGLIVLPVILLAKSLRQIPIVEQPASTGVEVDAGMKPGTRFDRRHVIRRRGAERCACSVKARLREILERLGVELIDSPEAAKLALPAIVVAMMIFVRGDLLGLADVINDLDFVYHLNGKRQWRDPGPAVRLVREEIAGGWGVTHPSGRPHVVVHADQQIRL